jgi:hypothetical protein
VRSGAMLVEEEQPEGSVTSFTAPAVVLDVIAVISACTPSVEGQVSLASPAAAHVVSFG